MIYCMEDTKTRQATPRILRLPDVLRMTGLSDETLAGMERKGEFPRRVALTARTVGWVEDEVIAWIEARVAARDDEARAFAQKLGRTPPAVRHRLRVELGLTDTS